MCVRIALAALAIPLVLAGCDDPRYTPPEASGLVSVRPFPNPGDVCVVVGESAATQEFLDDSATLIGCPTHERGAIADRRAEGAQVVGEAGAWTLLSVPDER